MQQEVGFDMVYCDWRGDIRLCGGQAEELFLMAVASPAILLLFSPTVLSFLFARIGWPRDEAFQFAVPRRLERAYLSVLGSLAFVSVLWAITPTNGWHEYRLTGMLLEFTSPGKWTAQALFIAAFVGGALLVASLLQFALERRLGQTYVALFVGSVGFSVTIGLVTISPVRAEALILWAIVGACLMVLVRITRLFAVATGLAMGAVFLAIGALESAGVVAAGGYESAVLIGRLLSTAW